MEDERLPRGHAGRARRYRERGWWPGVPLAEHFERIVRERPGAPAVLDERGRRLTREGLWRESGLLAAGLSQQGVAAGDVVLVFLPNRVESHAATLAALRLGAVPANIPVRTDEDTLGYAAELCGGSGARHRRAPWPGRDRGARDCRHRPLHHAPGRRGGCRRRFVAVDAGRTAVAGRRRGPRGRRNHSGCGSATAPRPGARPHHVHVEHHRPPQGGDAHERHPRRPQHHVHGAFRARPRCTDLHAVPARAQRRRDPRLAPRPPHRRPPHPPGPLGPRARACDHRRPRLPLHRRRDPLSQGPARRPPAPRAAGRPSSRPFPGSCAAALRYLRRSWSRRNPSSRTPGSPCSGG